MTDVSFTASIEYADGQRLLRVDSAESKALESFDGKVEHGDGPVILRCPLTSTNAAALRAARPALRPSPLGTAPSVGTGDRLGLATRGHAKAFADVGSSLLPIFAQQSIREMDRLNRSPQQVIDDATFGCVEAAWTGPYGADADHLKTVDDIDRCLAAGFTLFTLDAGDDVRPCQNAPTQQQLESVPFAALETDLAATRSRYGALRLDGPVGEVGLDDDGIARAVVKYGAAIVRTVTMYRHLCDRASYKVDVEIAIDETDIETTPGDHLYFAGELSRLGVEWVSFAPRYPGSFEKGVEFRGDRDALVAAMRSHAAVAQYIGPYKMGIHSGSDKFSIYGPLAEATGGRIHLKTSGTSYLVALQVLAVHDPSAFREIARASLQEYASARSSYHVSADGHVTDSVLDVPEASLPALVDRPDMRQVLHVGYGAALRTNDGEVTQVDSALRNALNTAPEEYSSALADHIGRHLRGLGGNG